MIKLFFLNFKEPYFQKSKKCFYAAIFLPGFTMGFFNLFAPFSIFRNIGFFSSIFGSYGALAFTLRQELDEIAMKRKDELGTKVRYRFKQLASYDGMQLSYKKEIERYDMPKDH